jgi:hypothetical protein
MTMTSTNISPTLDPGVIQGELAATRAARDGLARVRAKLEKYHAAEAAILNDRTLGEVARSAQVSELRAKVADAVRPVLELEYARVGESLALVEQKIDAQLYTTPQKTASREEIRMHVRRLPNERRIAFVRDRARAGDTQTVAAVLTAPGYLSGLDDVGQRNLRDGIAADLAPQLHAEREELRRVSQRLEGAASAFKASYVDTRPNAAVSAARARRDAIAAAEA